VIKMDSIFVWTFNDVLTVSIISGFAMYLLWLVVRFKLEDIKDYFRKKRNK